MSFMKHVPYQCCPRCGNASVFAGMLRFAPRCSACGLDFTQFNVGDGPAALLTLVVGALVVMFAVWLQLAAMPPWWVHVLLWVPLTVLGVIGGLRVAKGWLLGREYASKAGEHRHGEDGA